LRKKITKRLSDYDEKYSLKHLVDELIFNLKVTDGFTKKVTDFLPPPLTISVKNGDFSFATKKFLPDDGKTFRFRRINALYNEKYANGPLPAIFENLVKNGITKPGATEEDNNLRYNLFLDCISYSFFPGNPNRKFFFIVGEPHTGKTTFCKIFRNIFGSYACSLDMYSLMRHNRSNPELRPDLYGITDKLWIDVSELESGKKINTRLVKNLSGNDSIVMRKNFSNDMKEDHLIGKFFVVSNTYPQFDDRYDVALKERLIIFDWYNPIKDEDSIFDLVEILNSDENRSRIATFFICRAILLYKNGGIQLTESFNYIPELSLGFKEVYVNNFFTNCLYCNDGYLQYHQGLSIEVCRDDIYRAYLNFIAMQKLTIDSALNKRDFYKSLRNYLDKFPFVSGIRYPNDTFYKGVVIHNSVINFPLTIAQKGNFGKLILAPQANNFGNRYIPN
jgi:hypothetical protein